MKKIDKYAKLQRYCETNRCEYLYWNFNISEWKEHEIPISFDDMLFFVDKNEWGKINKIQENRFHTAQQNMRGRSMQRAYENIKRERKKYGLK